MNESLVLVIISEKQNDKDFVDQLKERYGKKVKCIDILNFYGLSNEKMEVLMLKTASQHEMVGFIGCEGNHNFGRLIAGIYLIFKIGIFKINCFSFLQSKL